MPAFVLAALLFLMLLAGGACAEDRFGTAVFLTETRLATLKARIAARTEPTATAWNEVLTTATAQLGRASHAPALWYVPGYYKDAEGHLQAKLALQEDANTAYTLALAYRMTEDLRFATAAVRLIDGWATQVQDFSRKDDSMLSFSYHVPPLILAADILRSCPAFPAEAQARFRAFLSGKALTMNTMERANNWGNWGLVLVLAGASYLDDRALFDRGVARWKVFIAEQIAEDGRLAHEVERNEGRSGLWYSNFTLLPQTLAAEIARTNGIDLYDYQAPNGRTLRQAFERLAPWTLDPTTFPYMKRDATPRHQTDYVSYYEILERHWPHPDARRLLVAKRPLTAIHGVPWLTFTHGDLLHDDGR